LIEQVQVQNNNSYHHTQHTERFHKQRSQIAEHHNWTTHQVDEQNRSTCAKQLWCQRWHGNQVASLA